jgi:hypothetical protein
MSNKRIIYNTEDGGVAIIAPSPEALETYTIDDIAQKDVPSGVPYKIVNADDIPTDREFRNAWESDASTHTDGVGSDRDLFYDDPTYTDSLIEGDPE